MKQFSQQTSSRFESNVNRQGRALFLLRRAREDLRRGRILSAIAIALAGGLIGPEVAFYTVFYPRMRDFASRVVSAALDRLAERRGISPHTAACLEHTDPWPDGWVGPRLVISREAGMEAHALLIQGWAHLNVVRKPLVLSASVDGQTIGKKRIEKSGHFTLKFSLLAPLVRGLHTVEVKATTWFVPHSFEGNEDYRPLSFLIEKVGFC